jgi:hypothetical protein
MLYDKRWEEKKPEIKIKTEEEWRTILLKAADILEKKGWCQQHYSRRGHYCALGAINKAAGFRPSGASHLPYDPVAVAERMMILHLGHDVAVWNDDLVDNAATVIATLRQVAKA